MGELISLYLSLHGEAGHFTDPLLNRQNARMKYKIIDIRTSAVTKSILIVISLDQGYFLHFEQHPTFLDGC